MTDPRQLQPIFVKQNKFDRAMKRIGQAAAIIVCLGLLAIVAVGLSWVVIHLVDLTFH